MNSGKLTSISEGRLNRKMPGAAARRSARTALAPAAAVMLLALGGCASPSAKVNKVDLVLRRQNYGLKATNNKLKRRVKRLKGEISTLHTQLGRRSPPLRTLSPKRLKELFTVRRIKILKSTRASAFDLSGPQRGFRVFVRTYGSAGLVLPASGTCTIQAFDLAIKHGSQRLGRWVFTPMQCKKLWYGMLGLNQFAFNCPWKKPPAHSAITFRIAFLDALTGRELTAQKVIKVHVKPPMAPTNTSTASPQRGPARPLKSDGPVKRAHAG